MKKIQLFSKITLLARLFFLLNLIVLYKIGGFLPHQTETLLIIVTPMSVLYVSAFLRFAFKYQYTHAEYYKVVDLTFPLLIFYSSYFIILNLVALWPSLVPFTYFKWLLFIGEILFAFIASTHLPNLLRRFPLD